MNRNLNEALSPLNELVDDTKAEQCPENEIPQNVYDSDGYRDSDETYVSHEHTE